SLPGEARHLGEQLRHREREAQVDEGLGDLPSPDPERAVARHPGEYALARIDDAKVVDTRHPDPVTDEIGQKLGSVGLSGGHGQRGWTRAPLSLPGRRGVTGGLRPGP